VNGPVSYLDHPLHLDGRGLTAETDRGDHVRDLIYQVLFTIPGERLNRPDFGCGLSQLVFMPSSDGLAGATQLLVHGALTRWLDEVIAVHRVEVLARESTIEVVVTYSDRRTGEADRAHFLSPWRP
jgi:phage baseplate assembly protein W